MNFTDHKSFAEIRDSIELLISMVEMAYGLPYKHDGHTTAIQFIDARLGRIWPRARQARDDKSIACRSCGSWQWKGFGHGNTS